LSERLKAGDVVVVDDLKLSSSPKTKRFRQRHFGAGLKGTTLVVSRRRTRT
jgi:ribosomal protein L4